MRTKKITLYYTVTQKDIIGPNDGVMKRKEDWIKQIQKSVEADWKPKRIKVTYEMYNPEVDDQRNFFNGPVVEYWVIQKGDILDRRPTSNEIKKGRETLLSEALGYKVELWDKTEIRRKSSSEFTEVQEWNDFLEELRETEFEPNGYEFPKSEDFWKLADKIGYDKAKEASIEKLQERIIKKLGITK